MLPAAGQAALYCGSNPEKCVRLTVNSMNNAQQVIRKINEFNQEMQQRAMEGDRQAHAYLYPETWQAGVGMPLPPAPGPQISAPIPTPTFLGYSNSGIPIIGMR